MDKAKKVCKFQIETFIKQVAIYYSIFISAIILLSIIAKQSEVRFASSGLELSTWVFIFVTALNSFKIPFYFAQANNVSRKSFYMGTVMYSIIVSLVVPIIDIIINRVYNLFVECPMNYDMIYGNLRNIDFIASMSFKVDNSIKAILENYLFLVGVLLLIFSVGLLITTLFFRLSRIGKWIIGGGSATLVVVSGFIPEIFWGKLGEIFSKIFGYESNNVFLGIISLITISTIIFGVNYILQRKVEVNK